MIYRYYNITPSHSREITPSHSREIMIITKHGKIEEIHLEKIQERLKRLSEGLNVEYINIAIKTAAGIYPGVTTSELDDLTEQISANSIINSYDYDIFAARIYMEKLHKSTYKTISNIYQLNDEVTNQFKNIINKHCDEFDEMIAEFERKASFSYMGLKTIESTYLLRSNNKDIILLPESHALYNYQQQYLAALESSKKKTKISEVKMFNNDIVKVEVPDYTIDFDYTNLLQYSNDDHDVAKKLFSIITQTYFNKVIERPAHMFLRTAINLHTPKNAIVLTSTALNNIKNTYNMFMSKSFIHASPTLMNSGIHANQLASCFLINMEDTSESIRTICHDVSIISKMSGGIGISLSEIRSAGSLISSSLGQTKGIIPIMKNLNELSRLWDQGGKRKGKFAIYLEPWHTEVREFLRSQHDDVKEEERCKDLLLALWVPDIFMDAVISNSDWYLMCPKECPNLTNTYGDEFNKLYYYYVAMKKYKYVVKARSIMELITATMTERGVPYILFKDQCNKKSNQKNLGTIKCSNLCAEILEYTSTNEYAVCNLANVCLGHLMADTLAEMSIKREFILDLVKKASEERVKVISDNAATGSTTPVYDLSYYISNAISESQIIKNAVQLFLMKVYNATQVLVTNLNNAIDKNNYPVEKTKNSNLKHRPIGIGIQGLADVFIQLGIPFVCDFSKKINKQIAAYMYYAALERSHELAVEFGRDVLIDNIRSTSNYNLNASVELVSELITLSESPSNLSPKNELRIGSVLSNHIAGMEAPHSFDAGIVTSPRKHSEIRNNTPTNVIGSYDSFAGSPISQGILQPHMWGLKTEEFEPIYQKSWFDLIEKCKKGVRNSLLLSNMPTQSTSHIMNSTECFEPITQLLFSKKTISGEFIQLNSHFQEDMCKLGRWRDKNFRQQLFELNGNISTMDLPDYIREIYKTIWDIKPSDLIKMDADRGAYICQTQSSNRFLSNPTNDRIYTMIKIAYENKLKTACYYLRSKPAANAIKFTITKETEKKKKYECNDDICVACQ